LHEDIFLAENVAFANRQRLDIAKMRRAEADRSARAAATRRRREMAGDKWPNSSYFFTLPGKLNDQDVQDA
jgi:hypothetical protein